MIVSIFNHGTGRASCAINYLLSTKDANGNIRNPPAEIYEGDRELTEFLINQNPRKYKYTSGVVSFRDSENPNEKQLREIAETFRQIFCPGMGPDRVNILWVKHEDKGNVELHFIVPMVAMVGKRTMQFNINPPGKHAQQLQKDFSAYWNHKLGYAQVVDDPIKASLSKFDLQVPQGAKNKKRKERLSFEVAKRIKLGTIKNRSELINFLEGKDCKIIRRGKDYLSIRLPGKDKAIRFRGGCFVESADYDALVRTSSSAKTKLNQERFNDVVRRINTSMEFRRAFNEKRYTVKKRIPQQNTNQEYRRQKTYKSEPVRPIADKHTASLQTTSSNTGHAKTPKINTTSVQKQQAKRNFGSFRTLGASIGMGTVEGIKASIGNLENSIRALGMQLTELPPEKRSEKERQLAVLKIQVMRLQQQLIEAEKAQLNNEPTRRPKI